MSAWENAVVTNKGIELQEKILASAPLEITKVVASTDNPSITQLVNLTGITDIKQNLSVQQFGYTESGTAALRVLLSNQNLTSSYVCHLIGIYAKDTDGEEILYAVAHSKDGDTIPSITDQPNGYTCEWCFNLTFSNSENISVSIDSASFVTIGAADERYAAIAHQHSFDDIEDNLGALLSNNLLLEPYFDAHSHRGTLGIIASIYPDDNGLMDICTFWKAKTSAKESLWSARVYDCTYGDQTIKALFIRHPDKPTSALDGVYQVLELPSTDSFTATIKLTFYAQVRDDDTPESTSFTIRPYISNTLSAANGTNNGVTIPNDGAWHKVEVQGTVSNGTIYVVLDSFPAVEAAQHWFHLAMPKAEIVSLSDDVHLLQTAKDAYFTKTDADLRKKIEDDELLQRMLMLEMEARAPRFPIPTDSVFDGTQASGVEFNIFANLVHTVITGYIASMTKATKSIGVIGDKYTGEVSSRTVRYYKDGKWHVGSCDIDSNKQITVTAAASAQDVQFSIYLSRDAAEDSVPIDDVLDRSSVSIEDHENGDYMVSSGSFIKSTNLFNSTLTGSANIMQIPSGDINQFKISIKPGYRPESTQNITVTGKIYIKNLSSSAFEYIDISNFNLQIKTSGAIGITNINDIMEPYNDTYTLQSVDVQVSLDYTIA